MDTAKPPNPSEDRGVSPAVRWLAIGLPMLAVAIGAVLVIQRVHARKPAFDFDQSSPEAVFASAKRMVSEGRADLLTELVYASSDAEREVWQGIGGILGALQDAGYAAGEVFPAEIRRIREQAMEAVERGELGSVMALIGSRIGGGGGGPSIFSDSDDVGADVIQSLLADPYGWLARNSEGVGFNPLGDRMVGLMFNGKPVLLGGMLGVLLELREDDRWYIMPPTNLPGVRGAIDNFIEETDRRSQILLVLLSLQQAFEDLATDMRSGKIRTLDHAATKFGEYAMVPVGLGAIAFGRYMEIAKEEKREERKRELEAKETEKTSAGKG